MELRLAVQTLFQGQTLATAGLHLDNPRYLQASSESTLPSNLNPARVFIFLLWRAPWHWFLEIFGCRPRVCKDVQNVLFCCAPLGAATFRRGQSKKKHHPGCSVFCSGPVPACTPGDDSKKILETNDTGHEQKGTTTKKNDSLTAALDRDAHSLLLKVQRPGGVYFSVI